MKETMNLPRAQFIERCKAWTKEFNNGKLFDIDGDPTNCPLHAWVVYNDACGKREMVPNTANCPLCGSPMCPQCNNHLVDQLSRVTGYMAPVSGWGASKKQEFKDRQRHTVG